MFIIILMFSNTVIAIEMSPITENDVMTEANALEPDIFLFIF